MDTYLTEAELGALIKRPAGTLRNWRYRGEGPRWIKTGRQVRYDLAEVKRWLASQTQGAA